jgi:hypothetical protein
MSSSIKKMFSSITTLLATLSLILLWGSSIAWATQASLQFSGNITSAYEGAYSSTGGGIIPILPPELSGATNGVPVAGTVSYETSHLVSWWANDIVSDYQPDLAGSIFTFQLGTTMLVAPVLIVEIRSEPSHSSDYVDIYARADGCLGGSIPDGWISGCDMWIIMYTSDGLASTAIPTSYTGAVSINSRADFYFWATPPDGSAFMWKSLSASVDHASITPILPPPQSVTLAMAIKAGGDLSPINPKSNGVVPVALMTTDDFDVSKIDISTVRFGKSGTEAPVSTFSIEDVDADGRIDLVLQFRTASTGIVCGTTLAKLTGKSTIGQDLNGSGAIKTVGCK